MTEERDAIDLGKFQGTYEEKRAEKLEATVYQMYRQHTEDQRKVIEQLASLMSQMIEANKRPLC